MPSNKPPYQATLPVGEPVDNWQPADAINVNVIKGQYCQLERLDVERHADELYQAFVCDSLNINWTYLPYGPFDNVKAFKHWLTENALLTDPYFFAVRVNDLAVGILSYLRIAQNIGSIEVGHIHFSPKMQRTLASTEAIYLLMNHAFTHGYRRFEWKCDALNNASKKAAERLGFQYEGTFRQATIYKGRNRDTAWFSIIDREWPCLNKAFKSWLSEDNHDYGKQRQSLSFFMLIK